MSSICFLSFDQQATVALKVIWLTTPPFISAHGGHWESFIERVSAGQELMQRNGYGLKGKAERPHGKELGEPSI